MNKSSNLDFYDKNEQHVNQIVSRFILVGNLVGPALIIGRALKIFHVVNYFVLVVFSICFLALSLFQILFSRKHPYSHATKYICLLSIEILVAFLSINPGLCMFMSYVIVPIFACMYFSKKCTVTMCSISYVVFVASIYIRSFHAIPPGLDYGLSSFSWFMAFSLGGTIEYFICTVLIYFVTKTTRETLDEQHRQSQKIQEMQSLTITGFANLVESKDSSTGEHVKRTSYYVSLICKKLRSLNYYSEELSDVEIDYMVKAAPLHDLGKINTPEKILSKTSHLTKEEFEIIKKHTITGEKMIETNLYNIEDKEYVKVAEDMALYHHEWWNGNGYPKGLSETDIPLAGRIMAAADVLDALLSARPYKNAFSLEDTMKIMKSLSGIQFDPKVIIAVESSSDDIREYLNEEKSHLN
ncbi:MAG: HD domain-containing phosphohydrolase [Treponema sp.]